MSRFQANFGFRAERPPATLEQIASLEAQTGFHLPIDYREFLLHWNGGTFGHYVYFALRDVPEEEFSVECDMGSVSDFYSLFDPTSDSDLRFASQNYRFSEAVPDKYLAIACNNSFECVCLSGNHENYGHIYWWDPGFIGGEMKQSDEDLRPIADNFSEFWEGLFESNDGIR